MRMVLADPFEERSIVIPPPDEEKPMQPARRPTRRRAGADDPSSAYLRALEALERDGRWPRHPGETPAAHSTRARADGLDHPSLGRLAAAYQLLRYGGRTLGRAERTRAIPRLDALGSRLRR